MMKRKFIIGLLALLTAGTFLCCGGCDLLPVTQSSGNSESVAESSEQQDSSSLEESTDSSSLDSSNEDEETESSSSSSSSGTEEDEVHQHTPNADDGDCTTDIKCSECGETVTPGNAAHSYDNACDADCNNAGCNGKRLVGAHVDSNGDKKCDHCNADIPQSGGVIVLPEDKFD